MREILYRAKAINRDNGYYRTSYKNGDWVYGLITRLYDERFEAVPAEMKNTNGVSGIEVDYRTIGQYTGLTDKNDKKIFEGDILRFGNFIVFVVWNDETLAWECQRANDVHYYGHSDHHQIAEGDWGLIDLSYIATERIIIGKMTTEIIGNIHDNPELLKGGVNNG